MSDKYTTARINIAGERFEILVHPEPAFAYRKGKSVEISRILVIDAIFTDASKALRASEEQLQRAFQTINVNEIAKIILRKGQLQLTIEQRRGLVDEKRKQIIAFISRNCVDPRTGFSHPPLRIQQAMDQIRLVIDPFQDGEEQAKAVIDKLRAIIPIKIEQITVALKVPATYSAQSIGVVKTFATIKKDEWQKDGSWIGLIEMPAGLYSPFLEKIGKVTKGDYQTKIVK